MGKKLHQFIRVLLALVIVVMLALMALGALPHLLSRIDQLDLVSNVWQALTAWWISLAPPARELISIGADLIGVFIALLAFATAIVIGFRGLYFQKRQLRKMDEASIPRSNPAFPFERFSTDKIDLLKKLHFGKHADLPYHPRFVPSRQESFETALDEKFLLLTGRRGLGKTRECIELFIRIAKRKGEEVTILYPCRDFDRPREEDIPTDFAPRTVIFFIDGIENRCSAARSKSRSKDTPVRTFNDRLTATIEWMREWCVGKDWRVVLTAIDEPACRERLQLDSAIWNDFRRRQLPGVHRAARPVFIRAVAKHFDLELDNRAVFHIAASGDGTPSGMIIPFAQESSRGSERRLAFSDITKYKFQYPADWDGEIYEQHIAPYPERKAVFEALTLLYRLRVPTQSLFVVDLAARLCQRGRLLILTKRRIARVIRQDLQAWMSEDSEEVICEPAYLNHSNELVDVVYKLQASVLYALKRKELMIKLLPVLPEIADKIAFELGLREDALKLLKAGSRQAPHFGPLWTAMAKLLGRHHEALLAAEAGVSADPQNFMALITLAWAQSKTGFHERSIATARRATEIAPKNDFAWLNLGVILSKLGNYDEAVLALKSACELNPQSAKSWYSLGVVYDRNDQREEAIGACIKATKLDPIDADAWHTLGIAYDRLGESESALDALQKAQKLDETDGSIWISLSWALCAAGKSGDAFKALDQAKTLARNDPDFLNQISIAFGVNGWHEEAVAAAQEARAIEPDHLGARRSLGRNLADLPGREEEVFAVRRQLAEQTDTADDWYGLSVALGKAGRHGDAVAAAQKALEIEPGHLDARRSLGRNLGYLPGREEEVFAVRRQLAEQTNTAEDWYGLSVALGTAGRHGDAVVAADRAISINPTDIDAWRSRAMNLEQQGSKEAVVAWRHVEELLGTSGGQTSEIAEVLHRVQIRPNSADAWKCLAYSYRNAGLTIEAVVLAREAVERMPGIGPSVIVVVEELLNFEPKAVADLMQELLNSDCNNHYYLHLRGAACRKMSDLSGAIVDLRRACDLRPNQAMYWYALGKAYEDSKNLDSAQVAFKEAVTLEPGYTKARDALNRVTKKDSDLPDKE